MSKPIVAVVGRPNVGKSTLFNKLMRPASGHRGGYPGRHPRPHLRQLRVAAATSSCWWTPAASSPRPTEGILAHMREQAQIAIDTADCIIMVVRRAQRPDRRRRGRGRTCSRRSGKPVVLAVNKCDNVGETAHGALRVLQPGAAAKSCPSRPVHGHGTGDLLDAVCAHLRFCSETVVEEDAHHRGHHRPPQRGQVQPDQPHPRGEPHDRGQRGRHHPRRHRHPRGQRLRQVHLHRHRRSAQAQQHRPTASSATWSCRALAAVERSRVALILVDATVGFTEQDSKVAGYAHDQGKACIIVVNKWDAVEGKETNTMELQRRGYAECFSFMGYAPIIFISAQTGYNVNKLMQLIRDVDSQNGARVPTGVLNEMLARATARMQPPSDKGRRLKIFYLTQASTRPPTFVAFVNAKHLFHFSYQRYIDQPDPRELRSGAHSHPPCRA